MKHADMIENRLKLQNSPDGAKAWRFRNGVFQFVQTDLGKVENYSENGFESLCLDIVTQETGNRPNRLDPETIPELQRRFYSHEFK